MKHSVERTDEGLRINADVAPQQQAALLDEFAKCAAGTCSCPSPQYAKLQSMDVASRPDGVTVNLQVKPGETMDIADIEKCLEYTARQIGD